jgi:hypothetical protein
MPFAEAELCRRINNLVVLARRYCEVQYEALLHKLAAVSEARFLHPARLGRRWPETACCR